MAHDKNQAQTNAKVKLPEPLKMWLGVLGLVVILFGCLYPHYLVRYIAKTYTSTTSPDTTHLTGLDWSPDGRQLALECATWSHSNGTERGKSYYLMQADGRNLHQLVNPTELPWPATFQKSARSPNDRRVAFGEPGSPAGPCGSAIYVMDGSNRRRINPLIELNLQCPAAMFGLVSITATLSSSSPADLPATVEFSSGGWQEVEYPFRESQSVTIPADGTVSLSYEIDSRDPFIPVNVAVMADGDHRASSCQIQGARPPKFLGILDLTVQQQTWLPLMSGLMGLALCSPWITAHWRRKRARVMVAIALILYGLTLFFSIGLWRELDQLTARITLPR